jgi:hypothetical protein
MSIEEAKLIQLLKDNSIATHKDLHGDHFVVCSLDKIRRLVAAIEQRETATEPKE